MRSVTLAVEKVAENPHMPGRDMDHWKCRLTCAGRSMTIHYSKGFGYHGEAPTLAEIQECLSLDCSSIEHIGFREWAEDFGFDSDSLKVRKTYKAIERQMRGLKRLLGEDYEEWMRMREESHAR